MFPLCTLGIFFSNSQLTPGIMHFMVIMDVNLNKQWGKDSYKRF